MKLLFDTHTFIWWDSEPTKLSPKALGLLSDKFNVKLLSVASIWEIQINEPKREVLYRSGNWLLSAFNDSYRVQAGHRMGNSYPAHRLVLN